MIAISGNGPVVMVDDDEVDVELLTAYFELSKLKDRHELLTFRTGGAFLEHMSKVDVGLQEIPSIVLLDINMPEMSGFDVLERLRADSRFADVPAVFFLSNSDSPRDIDRCSTLGVRFQEKFQQGQDCIDFFNSFSRDSIPRS